jgi:hypothetical protein
MRIDERIEPAGAVPGMRKEPEARAPFAPLRLFLFQWRGALRAMALMGGGMGVVVVLICALPLYTALIANVQLRQTLAAAPALQRNLAARITTSDPSPDALGRVETRVRDLAGRDLSALVAASTPVVALHTLQPLYFKAVDGRRVADARPELQIDHTLPYALDYAQAAPHMRLFAGRLPRDVPAGEPPEVLVTPKLLMKPSETLTVYPLFAPDQTVTMRVVGVWFPNDSADPFWNGADFDTFSTDHKPGTYPLLFTSAAFKDAFSSQDAGPSTFATLGAGVTMLYTPDTSGIDTATLQSTADRLARLRAHLAGDLRGTDGVETATLETGLGALFASPRAQLALLGLPLGMVVAQTVDPARLGVPPYTLTFDPARIVVFYAALLGALAASLLLGMRLAARAGVGQTMRMGKD